MKSHLRQAGRTALRTFDFRGRTGRGDVILYLVLSQIPVVLIRWAAGWFAPAPVADAMTLGGVTLITAALFALSVRRLHDFNRSGWWSLPLLLLVGRALLLDLLGLIAGWTVRSAIESVLSYVDWLLTLPAVAIFAALLAWPGSKGPNRFGPPAAAPPIADSARETTGAREPAPVA